MAFATDMLRRIEDDAEFLKRVMFSDEASFHLSGIINRHNVRICESENPHEYREAQGDSPKVNVQCGLMHDRVIGPFFFTEKTVSSVVYLDMLENFVFPQLEELQPHVFLQQDGAPPHWVHLRIWKPNTKIIEPEGLIPDEKVVSDSACLIERPGSSP
ncbi:hypothetical protein X975_12840, partial [Stegodyphus mimosarum]